MIRIETNASTVASNMNKYAKKLEDTIENRISVAGVFLEGKMVQKINSGLSPALKAATIKRKKSSKPLVDTGQLKGQITISSPMADRGKSIEVGVFGSRAKIAQHHEFGAPKAGIPERSFMRSAYKANRKHIVDIVKGK